MTIETTFSIPRRLAAAFVFFLATGAVPVAKADLIYDATGGKENGGDPISAAGPILADRFVSTVTGTLQSVTLNLAVVGTPGTGFSVDLFTDNGLNGPGTATLIANVNESTLKSSFALYTYTPTTTISLVAGKSYYIGISGLSTSNAVLGNTIDPTVLNRPSVVNGASYYNNGGVQANSGGPYEISVRAVPEPASLSMLIVGIAALGIARSSRPSGRAKPTTSFQE